MTENRRNKTRHGIHMVMPVRIVTEATGDAVDCKIDDVSSEGLGIVAQSRLEPGTRLVFETLERSFTFEVAWCRSDGFRCFKCGLRLAEAGKDLDRLFSRLIAARVAG